MKSIDCYYKDGALIFSTRKSYSYAIAHKVLEAFNMVGLASRIRLKSGQSFAVIGRLPVNYDPFETDQTEWPDVVSQLVQTKTALESQVKGY